MYVGCNFGYFFGGFGVLYGLLGSWEIPRAKNAELYDVFPKFAITDVHYACLNISLSSVTQGEHFSDELKCREGYAIDYCIEGCILDVIGQQ